MGILTTLSNLIKLPFIGNLLNRLVNRYTAHGIIIVTMQLEAMGVLPQGLSQNIDGLPASEIATWLTVAVGIYFIFHMPKFKTKLDKAKYQLELTKTELELAKARQELQGFNNATAKRHKLN